VLKHLKGQHDQQTHAGGGLSLPDGWSASRGDDRLLLDGPNNTKIVIDLTSGEPDEASLDLAVRTVNDLQNTFPVKDLTLVVSDKPFEEHEKANLIDKDALGFVMPTPDLQKTIHLRPAMLSQTGMEPMKLRSDDPSFFMASVNDTPSIQYILTHEYGHVLDRRGSKIQSDAYELYTKGIVDISKYGSSNEAERWAESFTEYVLTNGKTTNATAQYFADKYFWDEGVTKSVTEFEQSVNVLIVDTFSDKKRPYIVETITKHGDHNQLMHGNRKGGGGERPYELRPKVSAKPSPDGSTTYSSPSDLISQGGLGWDVEESADDVQEMWDANAVSIWQETLSDPANSPRVRVSDESLIKILKDERFKTVHEVHSSRADLVMAQSEYAGTRKRYEDDLMGVPPTVTKIDRPVYGYIKDSDGPLSVFDQGYGDFDVVLKDSVRGRMTVTAGDSLDAKALPVWHDDVVSGNVTPNRLFLAGGNAIPNEMARVASGQSQPRTNAEYASAPQYWEAQIHGGVKLSDIAYVEVSRAAWEASAPTFRGLVDEKGIEVRFVE
jgi:hypothetical protein